MDIQEIPDVKIEKDGSFKYVAFDVFDVSDKSRAKHIVRGYDADWHRDIVRWVHNELGSSCYSVRGGGRIRIDHETRTIVVGGRSGDYGEADHEATIALLKPLYPDYQFSTTDTYDF